MLILVYPERVEESKHARVFSYSFKSNSRYLTNLLFQKPHLLPLFYDKKDFFAIIIFMIISPIVFTIPPLFFITCSYIFGLSAQQTGLHCTIFPIFAVLFMILFLILYKHNLSIYTITLLILTAGAYPLGSFLLHRQKYHALEFYAQNTKKSLDLMGTISDISYIDHHLFNNIITLDHICLKDHGITNAKWQSHDSKFQIYTKIPNNIAIADIIELNNIKIAQPPCISYQHYLLKENVAASSFMPKCNIKLISRPQYSLNRLIALYRSSLCDSLKNKMSSQGFSIFCPLFLGKRNLEKKTVMQYNTELFTIWGITHYLARSGLHLVVLITLWLSIFTCLPISFNKKQWLLLFISLMYFLLSWSSIPFYRALTTVILHRLCLLVRLQSHFLHLLILTCLSILLLNPIQLFFLDFQLSFGLTFALACFSHINGYKRNNLTKYLHLKNKIS